MITIEIIAGPRAGERIAVADSRASIGRNPEGSLALQDSEASWVHCELTLAGDSLLLTDLGSSNGTFIGDQRLSEPIKLDPGMTFRVGATQMKVWYVGRRPKPTAPTGAETSVQESVDSTMLLERPSDLSELMAGEFIAAQPRIDLIAGPRAGLQVLLAVGRTSLGRSSQNAVSVMDPRVGLYQLLIEVDEQGRCVLSSLDEDWTVTINDQPLVGSIHLRHGDLVGFGTSVAEFGEKGIDSQTADPMKTMALPQGRFTVAGQVMVQPEVRLGRDPSAEIYLDGPREHIARCHATIRFILGVFKLETSGGLRTSINGERVVEHLLENGDQITIGHYVIYVTISGITCDLRVTEKSGGVVVESFASSHACDDPYRTMYRLTRPSDIEVSEEVPDEGPVQRHRPVWVPPLETRDKGQKTVFALVGVVVGLLMMAYFTWPSGAGYLGRPLSDAHNSAQFAQEAAATLGEPASCASCHQGFGGLVENNCTRCHEERKTGTHAAAQVGCAGCHIEHPSGTKGTALVSQNACVGCHDELHSELIRLSVAPAGAREKTGLTKIAGTHSKAELHTIHRGVQGRCAGCHANEARTAPIEPSSSCIRCHGSVEELAVSACSACHLEHESLAQGETGVEAATSVTVAVENTGRGPMTTPDHMRGSWWALVSILPVLLLVLVRRREYSDSELSTYQPAPSTPVKKLIHIHEEPCVGCAECVIACPYEVLDLVKLKDSGKMVAKVINFDSCRECGTCADVCKPLALTRRYPGEPLPMVSRPDLDPFYMTNLPGLYLIGEASGNSLVRNASNLGARTIRHILHTGVQPGSARTQGVDYEVVIVGSGPGGLSAGITALDAGLTHLVLEKGDRWAQTIFGYPKGKPVQNQPESTKDIGALPLGDVKREKLLSMWEKTLAGKPINIEYKAEVTGLEPLPAGAGYRVLIGDRTVTANRVILATGTRGRPRKLKDVPGNDLDKIKYRLVDPEIHQGQRVVVVGGGNTALEAAIAIARVDGAPNEVRLVYRKDTFARASAKNITELEALAQAGRIILHLNANPVSVSIQHIVIEDASGGRYEGENDAIYCMLGAEPPTRWLTSIGITFSEKPQGWTPGPSDDLGFASES